jgi:hypothetical protein
MGTPTENFLRQLGVALGDDLVRLAGVRTLLFVAVGLDRRCVGDPIDADERLVRQPPAEHWLVEPTGRNPPDWGTSGEIETGGRSSCGGGANEALDVGSQGRQEAGDSAAHSQVTDHVKVASTAASSDPVAAGVSRATHSRERGEQAAGFDGGSDGGGHRRTDAGV